MVINSLTLSPVTIKRRITKARQQVLDLIQQQAVAVKPGDLEKQLKPLMNRVTVYRSLQVLLKEGLIGRLADGEYRVRYYARKSKETEALSVQFSCNLCHQLIDFPELIVTFPRLPTSFHLNTGQLLMTGLCPDCFKN